MQVGDGCNIRVWEDCWISVTPPKRLVSPCTYPNMKVSEFIDSANATWKGDKLNAFLLPEEVELIKAIRLSKQNQCD